MPEPHFTYYVTVSGYHPKFLFSGEGQEEGPGQDNQYLTYQSHCSDDGKIYKFDQSDASNLGYRLHFSNGIEGTHDAGGLDLDSASGVYFCGTPGQAGASTKVSVSDYYDDMEQPTIYPFNPVYTGMGGSGASQFDSDEESSGPCSDGDYECLSGCNQITGFTGQLNTLINSTNATQSGTYGNFTTLSYTQATGMQTGTFYLGDIIATGSSLSNALLALTPLISHFAASGVRIDQARGVTRTTNINNNTPSYSSTFTGYGDSVYYQGVSGYVGKRFYVGYNPQISGNYTGASANFACPETSIEVSFDRNRLIYLTTGGLTSQGEKPITQFVASLESTCTGHETTLQTSCSKFSNGEEKFGKIAFNENMKNAWSGSLAVGSYILRYVSGSFTTSLGNHTLGSGTINVDRYV